MQTIGPYRLLQALGTCQVGGVWSAIDTPGNHVTLAILNADAARDPGWRNAFAEAAHRLGQAGQIPVVTADFTVPTPWVASSARDGSVVAGVFGTLGVAYQPLNPHTGTVAGPANADQTTVNPTRPVSPAAGTAAVPGSRPVSPGSPAATGSARVPGPQLPEGTTPALGTPAVGSRASGGPLSGGPLSGGPTAGTPAAGSPAAGAEPPTSLAHPPAGDPGAEPPTSVVFPPPPPSPVPTSPPMPPMPQAGPYPPSPAMAAPQPAVMPPGPPAMVPQPPVHQPPQAPQPPVHQPPAVPQAPPTMVPPAGYPPAGHVSGIPGAVSGVPAPGAFTTVPAVPPPVPPAGQPRRHDDTPPHGFPATAGRPPGSSRRRTLLLVGVLLLVVVVLGGGGAAVAILLSPDDGTVEGGGTPPPSQVGDGTPAPAEPAAPGVEPPVEGEWPADWPTFEPGEPVATMTNLAGVGFSFDLPQGWSCTSVSNADGMAHYTCGPDGAGGQIGGDLIVRSCPDPCDSDRRVEMRRAEEAWGLQWVRDGGYRCWAETDTVDGEPRYGLVFVAYGRTSDESRIDRQVVFRMTAPPGDADQIRKIGNSVRTATS